MLWLGNIINAVKHTGRNQQLNGVLILPRPRSILDAAVNELLIALGKLRNNASEHQQNPSTIDFAVTHYRLLFKMRFTHYFRF